MYKPPPNRTPLLQGIYKTNRAARRPALDKTYWDPRRTTLRLWCRLDTKPVRIAVQRRHTPGGALHKLSQPGSPRLHARFSARNRFTSAFQGARPRHIATVSLHRQWKGQHTVRLENIAIASEPVCFEAITHPWRPCYEEDASHDRRREWRLPVFVEFCLD